MKIHSYFALILLAALSVSPALAKGGKDGKNRTPEEKAEAFVRKWDKDGDGKLDAKELAAAFADRQEKRQNRHGGPTASPVASPAPSAAH